MYTCVCVCIYIYLHILRISVRGRLLRHQMKALNTCPNIPKAEHQDLTLYIFITSLSPSPLHKEK